MTTLDFERDGDAIYRRSFATIRAETNLTSIPPDLEAVVVRMVHASGMVDLVDDVGFSPEIGEVTRAALRRGAPILCDAMMVVHGVTRKRLPRHNEVRCSLLDPDSVARAQRDGITRSMAAVDAWVPELEGAVVAIGNAPTALFRLLELLADGAPRPAAIIGIPVGFVGAAESKVALATIEHGVPWITVHGRRGGSAVTAAAINAFASEQE